MQRVHVLRLEAVLHAQLDNSGVIPREAHDVHGVCQGRGHRFLKQHGFVGCSNGMQDVPVGVVGRCDHDRVYRLIQTGLTQIAIDRERRVGEQTPVGARPLETPTIGIDNALHVCPAK